MPGLENKSRFSAEDREHLLRAFTAFIDSPELCPGSVSLTSLTNGDVISVEVVRREPPLPCPIPPSTRWEVVDNPELGRVWTVFFADEPPVNPDVKPATWRELPPQL